MCSLGRYSPPLGIELLRAPISKTFAASFSGASVLRRKTRMPTGQTRAQCEAASDSTPSSWSQTHEISIDR